MNETDLPVTERNASNVRTITITNIILQHMKSDIQIAREAKLKPIAQVASSLGIDSDRIEPYGRYIAKLPLELIDDAKVRQSRLILVTATTPTKAGIGKTTVSVGLAMGLCRIGKKALTVLRDPALGPCFGMKGGAAGGG